MEFREGLKLLKEMCERQDAYCHGCELDVVCPFGFSPHEWSDEDADRIADAVEKWKSREREDN